MMKGVGTFWISMDFTQKILSGSCEKLNNLQRRRVLSVWDFTCRSTNQHLWISFDYLIYEAPGVARHAVAQRTRIDILKFLWHVRTKMSTFSLLHLVLPQYSFQTPHTQYLITLNPTHNIYEHSTKTWTLGIIDHPFFETIWFVSSFLLTIFEKIPRKNVKSLISWQFWCQRNIASY